MKIKSLLIGSAALMTVSTGSYAADAVVMAEPEPVEYVRVCDVYGAGFFYIPGTETCLKIGGYVRDDIQINPGFADYWNRARFTSKFDARSETELGTLRAYAEVEFTANTGIAVPAWAGAGQSFNIAHAYIELQGATGTFRIGRTHTPFARFLGYGPTGFTNDGSYGYNNQSEVSYTFNGGNGFSAIIALVENAQHASPATNAAAITALAAGAGGWSTNVEGGINFKQGWGSIGAMLGYDSVQGEWGGKLVARFTGSNGFLAGLHVFYASSGTGWNAYRVAGFSSNPIFYQQNWSVLGHVTYQATPKMNLNLYAQWFDAPTRGGAWDFAGSVGWTPVTNLLIRPEIHYAANGVGASAWSGVVRFQRDF